jgi:hypothetical protein
LLLIVPVLLDPLQLIERLLSYDHTPLEYLCQEYFDILIFLKVLSGLAEMFAR